MTVRLISRLLKETGAIKIVLIFLAYVFAMGIIVLVIEPGIDNYGDALWYCYSVATTVGFGDVLAVTFPVRVLSVVLSFYAAIVIAIITGVVVRYFQTVSEIKNKETLEAFMDELETIGEMSQEQRMDLVKRVKRFRRTHQFLKNISDDK